MNLQNYNKVIDSLVAKSGFLEKDHWLVNMARQGAEQVLKHSIVEDPKDKYDDVGNYIPNKYDSLFFNCVFKDTHDVSSLYTTQLVQEEEQVLYCEENFSTLQFSTIEQSMGIGLAYVASAVRDVYDEMIEEGCTSIADFTVPKISPKLGGLADIDFITKPSASRRDEVPPVKVHRRIINSLLGSIMSNEDTVLVIGGDGGSGSKRARGYSIDCLYYSKKQYEMALSNRKKFGGRGKDYFYHTGFISELPLGKYKVVMFNYCAKEQILKEIIDKYLKSNVIVFGMVCDPILTDKQDIRLFNSDEELQSYVNGLRKKGHVDSKKRQYVVLGVSNTKIAVYTDHGIFIDDRWYVNKHFISINRVEIAKKFNIGTTYDGIEHGSLKILDNNKNFIDSLSFRLSDDDHDNIVDTMRIFSVKDKKIYDDDGVLYYNYTNLPNCKLSCYRSSKDNKLKFFDIDIGGTYWYRRSVLALSNIPLDSGNGLIVSTIYEFGGIPVFKTKTFEQMQMRYSSIMNTIGKSPHTKLKMPDMFVAGCYYNPLLTTWVGDSSYVMPYVVVDADTPPDAGLDFILKEGKVDAPVSKDDPIQIDDNLYIQQVDSRNIASSYIRIYNYESTKMPKDVYCLDRVGESTRLNRLLNLGCFSGDTVPSDVFGFDDNRECIDDYTFDVDIPPDENGESLF